MKIIKQWQELKALTLTDNVQQDLLHHLLLTTTDNNEQELTDNWMDTMMIVINHKDDDGLTSLKDSKTFIKAFPKEYQDRIENILNYPEYIEPLNEEYFIALSIWSVDGSGTFLVFDKELCQSSHVLKELVKENTPC